MMSESAKLVLILGLFGAMLPSHAQTQEACKNQAVDTCFRGCDVILFDQCVTGCISAYENNEQKCDEECSGLPFCEGKCRDTISAIRACIGGLGAQDAACQVRYVSNLNVADSLINITNTGANGAMPFGPGIGPEAGNLCVNVYAFSPDEQMVGCCSCHVTPNGLASLSVYNDIRAITLTGLTPNSMMIKLVAAGTGPGPSFGGGASACSQSAAGLDVTHPVIQRGLAAWATTGHVPGAFPVPGAPAPFGITETRFTPATLSAAEITSLNNRCTAILGNGSTFGTCRSCTVGGRGSGRLSSSRRRRGFGNKSPAGASDWGQSGGGRKPRVNR